MVFDNANNTSLRIVNAATTLTIGAGITVRGGSSQAFGAYIGFNPGIGGASNVSVINQGTIAPDTAGMSITFSGQSFTNLGTMTASGGGTLNLIAAVTNSGEILPGGDGGIGVVAITGNYTQTTLGIVNIEIRGTPQSQVDRLTVTGCSHFGWDAGCETH